MDLTQAQTEQGTAKAKGGYARAVKLTPEERKAIARKAAETRWASSILRATHEGEFRIGDTVISAAVLEDGRRLITQAAFLRAMGRARSPKAGTGVFSTVDSIPFFLQSSVLKPYITDDLLASTKPVFYESKSGGKGVGYEATALPQTCEVYLKLRDNSLAQSGRVPRKIEHIVWACDIVMRGLARVGIVALVDEATGYQEVRDRQALQQILDAYIGKELAKWVSTFPQDFYEQIFRLKGWSFDRSSSRRPKLMANLTVDLIYRRLAPGVLAKLRELTPKDEHGRRKNKLFQWLTADIGHPALKEHLSNITFLAKSHDDWDAYYKAVNRVAPRFGDTLPLPFPEEESAVVTLSNAPGPLFSQSPSA